MSGPFKFHVNANGFTYISLLFLVTVMGIALSVAGHLWSTASKREKEEELLFRGMEIRRAVGRFYEESPGAKFYPRSLEELLKDPRHPSTKRYLRKIYADPFTGEPDWELVTAPEGGVMGVKSRSSGEPLKKKGFPKDLAGFEDRSKYSEWEFVYRPVPISAGSRG